MTYLIRAVTSGDAAMPMQPERRYRVIASMSEAREDPRVPYAADRTVLAAERTYAAWVRTGLVALAAGGGAKTSLVCTLPEWAILFFASLLVLFSGFWFAVAVWRELRPG